MTNVVIGAGSGMGTAVARALAPRGPLIVADRDLEAVEVVRVAPGTEPARRAADVMQRGQGASLGSEFIVTLPLAKDQG